jgi:hypothetical protein
MSANEPLTEEEVKQLVLTFWKWQEEKAHLVDLMEVTAPDLEISMGEFAWHGYRGLEDHQMGSKDQFFDQHFEPRSISVELSGEEATVKSEVQWNARHWTFPAAKSQEIRAIYLLSYLEVKEIIGGRQSSGCTQPWGPHEVCGGI